MDAAKLILTTRSLITKAGGTTMITNLIKCFITVAAVVTVTLAIGAGGASAQGAVPELGSGTITSGNLTWLKNANCFGLQDWNTAKNSAASLKSGMCGLNDGSTAGQWRLPTKGELKWRLTYYSEFNNFPGGWYWTNTPGHYNYDTYWIVCAGGWDRVPIEIDPKHYVLPVRSKQ
jgi:hypothetical protein